MVLENPSMAVVIDKRIRLDMVAQKKHIKAIARQYVKKTMISAAQACGMTYIDKKTGAVMNVLSIPDINKSRLQDGSKEQDKKIFKSTIDCFEQHLAQKVVLERTVMRDANIVYNMDKTVFHKTSQSMVSNDTEDYRIRSGGCVKRLISSVRSEERKAAGLGSKKKWKKQILIKMPPGFKKNKKRKKGDHEECVYELDQTNETLTAPPMMISGAASRIPTLTLIVVPPPVSKGEMKEPFVVNTIVTEVQPAMSEGESIFPILVNPKASMPSVTESRNNPVIAKERAQSQLTIKVLEEKIRIMTEERNLQKKKERKSIKSKCQTKKKVSS
jgi:hypothetical protein